MEMIFIAMLFFNLDVHALEHRSIAICNCASQSFTVEYLVRGGEEPNHLSKSLKRSKLFTPWGLTLIDANIGIWLWEHG
jgi:hypothetical protein